MSRDALVIGINKYPFLKNSSGSQKHLNTPASDAEAIAKLLEAQNNFRVKRFPARIIDGKLQVDPDKPFKTEELEKAILDLFLPETGKPPETALLFFAGHGLRKQLRANLTQGFLAASDVNPGRIWGFALRDLFHQLFQEILHADFKYQVPLVKEVIKKHQTAAFLIHGEQYCGQQLLVTRLSHLKAKWKNISPIKVDVGQRAVGGRLPYLWQQLTSWFGLPKDAESNQIIERVCDRLLTQDVIFIFDRVNDMQPRILSKWLQEFWEALVVRVEEHCPSPQRDTHLLMFLVDNNGSVCKSDILLAKKFDEPKYPKIPLDLPPISPFTVDILEELIDRVTTIPNLQIPVDLTSQILFDKSENGIPEFVYEEICDFCGHSWEGDLAKWLI